MKGFIRLDRIRGEEEYKELCILSKKDMHGVYMPTQVVRRDDKILGYFSIGSPGAPIVFAWLDVDELRSRESFHLINMVECLVASAGAQCIAFPVPKNSPFHPLMESMGYTNGGSYDFFFKKV